MTELDLVLLICILFGGWLGAVKGSVRAFISLAGTVLGLAIAGLYGAQFFSPWQSAFDRIALSVSLELPWAATVSTTQAGWRQSASTWLAELLWPNGLKALVVSRWAELSENGTIASFAQAVERCFFSALSNILALVFLVSVTKLLVSFLANVSLRFALGEQHAASPLGFFVGLAQSAILVIGILALMVPFFVWVTDVPLVDSIQPSLTWKAVQWFWNSILRT